MMLPTLTSDCQISTDEYKLLNNSQTADNLVDDDLNGDDISSWVGGGGGEEVMWFELATLKFDDNILMQNSQTTVQC